MLRAVCGAGWQPVHGSLYMLLNQQLTRASKF